MSDDPDNRDSSSKDNRKRLLRKAAAGGDLQKVQELVQSGVDVNSTFADGWTPLHEAAFVGHLQVVKFLIENHANVEADTNIGQTSLHHASGAGRLEIVNLLLSQGKANVEATHRYGRTPLHFAAYNGHLEVARTLRLARAMQFLVKECNTNVQAENIYGRTPLHDASMSVNLHAVKYLVKECGAEIEAENSFGWTALHEAASHGRVETVQWLREEGKANVHAKSHHGQTPLQLAQQRGHSSVVELLESNSLPPSTASTSKLSTVATSTSSEWSLVTNIVPATTEMNTVSSGEIRTTKAPDPDIQNAREQLKQVMVNPNGDPVELNRAYIEQCIVESSKLGGGAFGVVYLGKDSFLPKDMAVKRIAFSVHEKEAIQEIMHSFKREVTALKQFRHPNIVALYGYNIQASQRQQYIVYELVHFGSLDTFLKDGGGRARLSAGIRLSIMFQIVRALHFLHSGGCGGFKLLHRDIKASNICIDSDYNAKLIDCGLAKFVKDDNPGGISPVSMTPSLLKSSGAAVFGTRGYICPVYARGKAYNAASDVYSFGVVMIELILGCLHREQSSRGTKKFGDVFELYIEDEDETRIEDGWKLIMKDADPTVVWSKQVLENVCKLAVECMTPSRKYRKKTDEIILALNGIIRQHWDTGINNENEATTRSCTPQLTRCALCNRECDGVYCTAPSVSHFVCGPCLDDCVCGARGQQTPLCCPIDGCRGSLGDKSIYGILSKDMYDRYMKERTTTESSPVTKSTFHEEVRPYDIFWVHTGAQKRVEVAAMHDRFSSHGFRCFLDMEMKPGSYPGNLMGNALESCRHAVVILSREFLTRPNPCAELQYAYKRMIWLRQQESDHWQSLWVVLYDISVKEYKEIRKYENTDLPALDEDIVLIEYAGGSYKTWPLLCDDLEHHIADHDEKGSAIERWRRLLSRLESSTDLDFDFPRCHGVYHPDDR